MNGFENSWVDDAAGPLIRPYTVTRGRTMSSGHDVDMLTVIAAVRPGPRLRRTEPEYATVMRLCGTPQSVAEVSAALRLPLAVTKILVGDLIADGNLTYQAPIRVEDDPGKLTILQAVLDGIRRL